MALTIRLYFYESVEHINRSTGASEMSFAFVFLFSSLMVAFDGYNQPYDGDYDALATEMRDEFFALTTGIGSG